VILIWLVVAPELRQWLISPWPYLGGLIAVAIFSPVLFWNADYEWMSFIKQFARTRMNEFKPRFLALLVPSQFLFATPTVFILRVKGFMSFSKASLGHGGHRF
jgi:hypothetical protein